MLWTNNRAAACDPELGSGNLRDDKRSEASNNEVVNAKHFIVSQIARSATPPPDSSKKKAKPFRTPPFWHFTFPYKLSFQSRQQKRLLPSFVNLPSLAIYVSQMDA